MSMLDKALQTLLGMAHKEILWKNASPSSNFSKQKINLNLSGYDAAVIKAVEQVNGDDYRKNTIFQICENNEQSTLLGIGAFETGKTTVAIERSFKVMPSGVDFNNAYYRNIDSTGGTTANDSYVPLIIYGIKLLGGGTAQD